MNKENTFIDTIETFKQLGLTFDRTIEIDRTMSPVEFFASPEAAEHYRDYENVMAIDQRLNGSEDLYHIAVDGSIYHDYISGDGVRFVTELALHSCLSNGGVDSAMVLPNLMIAIRKKNWEKCPGNFRIWAQTREAIWAA